MNFIEKSNGIKKKLDFFNRRRANQYGSFKHPLSNKNSSNSRRDSTPSTEMNWGKSRQSVSFSGIHSEASINNEDSRIVMALSEGRGEARCEVGLAVINVTQPHIILCQISDTQSYDNTLRKINIFNPSQILIPMTFVETANTSRLIEKVKEQFPQVTYTPVRRNTYNKTSGIEFIQELCVSSHNSVLLVLQYKYYALTAASALFKFLQNNLNIFYASNSIKIEYEESEGYAVIDVSTADRLELVSSAKPLQASRYSTLFGVLNNCYTKIGERALRTLLLQPPFVTSIILERQQCVTALMRHPEKLQSIQVMLQKLGNVDQLLTLPTIVIDGSQSCSSRQLNYILYINGLVELIITLSDVISKFDQQLFKNISVTLKNKDFLDIRDTVRTLIHENAYAAKSHNGLLQRCFAIKPGLNSLLDLVRKIYSERLDDMREYVKTLADKYDLPLTLGNNTTKGYHIVLSLNKRQRTTMKKTDVPKEFIQVCRLAGSFTMKTMELLNFQTRIDDIIADILKISNVMIFKTLTSFKKYMGLFYKLCEDIALIDVLQSLAEVSIRNNYVKPTFSDYTKVKESQHPMLDMLAHEKPVPNLISSCRNYNVHIITGPNGSGKSIYIRQVMLLQIMAQIGGYVPALSAVFRPADRLFARVYLEDNMECGASSFVLEMKEIIYILSHISDSSLVIIDELARSTSLEEGAALAMAICESFVETSAFVYLTSHFTLVTKLGDLYLNVRNWFMETDASGDTPKSLQLNFRHCLKSGVTNLKRYGIFMVKNIWPSDLLEDIYSLLEQNKKSHKVVKTTQISKESRLQHNLEADLQRYKSEGRMIPSKINELMNRYQNQFENLNPDMDCTIDDRIQEQPLENSSYFDNTVPDDILSEAVDQFEYSVLSSQPNSSYQRLSHFIGEDSENINLLNPEIYIHESSHPFIENIDKTDQQEENSNPKIKILSNVLLNVGQDDENNWKHNSEDQLELYSNLRSCSQESFLNTQDSEEVNDVNRSLLAEMKSLKHNLNSEDFYENEDNQNNDVNNHLMDSFENESQQTQSLVEAPASEQYAFDSSVREENTSDFCFLKPSKPPSKKRFGVKSEKETITNKDNMNETNQITFSLGLMTNREKTSTPISSRKDFSNNQTPCFGSFIESKPDDIFQSQSSIIEMNSQNLLTPDDHLVEVENDSAYSCQDNFRREHSFTKVSWGDESFGNIKNKKTENSSIWDDSFNQIEHIFPEVQIIPGPSGKSISFGEENEQSGMSKQKKICENVEQNELDLERYAIEETKLLLSDSADLFDGDVDELEITIENNKASLEFDEKRSDIVIKMLGDEGLHSKRQKGLISLENDVLFGDTQFKQRDNSCDDLTLRIQSVKEDDIDKKPQSEMKYIEQHNELKIDELNKIETVHTHSITVKELTGNYKLFEESHLDNYLDNDLIISTEKLDEPRKPIFEFNIQNPENISNSKNGEKNDSVRKTTISTSLSEASRKRNIDISDSSPSTSEDRKMKRIKRYEHKEDMNFNSEIFPESSQNEAINEMEQSLNQVTHENSLKCTSPSKISTTLSDASRRRNLENSSSTSSTPNDGGENEKRRNILYSQHNENQIRQQSQSEMMTEIGDHSSKDKVTTSISSASRKRNLDNSTSSSSSDYQNLPDDSKKEDSSSTSFQNKLNEMIVTKDHVAVQGITYGCTVVKDNYDVESRSSECYETATDTDVPVQKNSENIYPKLKQNDKNEIESKQNEEAPMAATSGISNCTTNTVSKTYSVPFRSVEEIFDDMGMDLKDSSKNSAFSRNKKQEDETENFVDDSQDSFASMDEDSLNTRCSGRNERKKRKYLGYKRPVPQKNKSKKEETIKIKPLKLTKFQIKEEFDKQDEIVLEENLTIETYNKYLMQRMNRPSIKQLQNAEYIATFRKTENGAIVIPTKKKTYKPRKVLPTKVLESGKAIDVSIFSDQNASKLSAFLASKERSYSQFKFESSGSDFLGFGGDDSLSRSIKFCSQFMQRTKKIELGRSKSFGEFKLHSFAKISENKRFEFDGQGSQRSESSSIFLPDGFFKQNKKDIDDICTKYLKQDTPFRFFRTKTSPSL